MSDNNKEELDLNELEQVTGGFGFGAVYSPSITGELKPPVKPDLTSAVKPPLTSDIGAVLRESPEPDVNAVIKEHLTSTDTASSMRRPL